MTPITDEQRELIVSMCRNGHGRNAIAKVVGVAGATVSKIVAEAGLNFGRTVPKEATAARKIEIAERRSKLELDLLNDAGRLRRELWEETTYYQAVGGADPRVMEWKLNRPIPSDQYRIMQAATTAITASQRIADAAADQGTEAAKSMLTGLMEQLGGAWRDLQAADLEGAT